MNANDPTTSDPSVHEVTKGYFVVYDEFDNWPFLRAEQKTWPIVQLQSTAISVGDEDLPGCCKHKASSNDTIPREDEIKQQPVLT